MEISIRKIGSKIIELTVDSDENLLTKEITKLDGTVDQDFINRLREIADELEDHNSQINKCHKEFNND